MCVYICVCICALQCIYIHICVCMYITKMLGEGETITLSSGTCKQLELGDIRGGGVKKRQGESDIIRF